MNDILHVSHISDPSILILHTDEDDYLYRINTYLEWLQANNIRWYSPELNYYRDYLLKHYLGRDQKPLHPNSVRAHLSTIRGRYKKLIASNRIRDRLFEATSMDMPFLERKAFVDEIIQRIKNAIDPINSVVDTVTKQDIIDRMQLRLTVSQSRELMNSPDTTTLIGLRDRALICLMLCTGVREAEACSLHVDDLYQSVSNQPVLHVRHGKGRKERTIPYGDLIWVRKVVETWLNNAGITHNAVYRGLYKGGKRIRRNQLTVRAVNQILDKYPINIDGHFVSPKPHDLRRTYARRLYESGLDLVAIRDNLGHADTRTTLKYIGVVDIDKRKPPSIY